MKHVAVDADRVCNVPVGATSPTDMFAKTVGLCGDALTAEQRARLMAIAGTSRPRTLRLGSA